MKQDVYHWENRDDKSYENPVDVTTYDDSFHRVLGNITLYRNDDGHVIVYYQDLRDMDLVHRIMFRHDDQESRYGVAVTLQQLLWFIVHDELTTRSYPYIIDHRNRDKMDNRMINLHSMLWKDHERKHGGLHLANRQWREWEDKSKSASSFLAF